MVGDAIPRTELDSYVDLESGTKTIELVVAYPLVAATRLVGDDLAAAERPRIAENIGAGAGAGDVSIIARYYRREFECIVNVVVAEFPQTLEVDARAICRRKGDVDFTEVYYPIRDLREPHILDVTSRNSVREWPLVTVRLVSDGVVMPGGAWTGGAFGDDASRGFSGHFGEAVAMAPGDYRLMTFLGPANKVLQNRNISVSLSTKEVDIDVGDGLRMCHLDFMLADGSRPRFVAWVLKNSLEWKSTGVTEGTEFLPIIAPVGQLDLQVRCFGSEAIDRQIEVLPDNPVTTVSIVLN